MMCGTVLNNAVCVLSRGDDDIHQLIATSTIKGIVCDGSGCVDDHIRTAAAGGAAAVLLSHYRQNQTESIK
jgi:hypothetical protein